MIDLTLQFGTDNSFIPDPRYQDEFPYVSLCGIERNFIRCDDVPIVFTHIVPNTSDSSSASSQQPFNLVIAFSDLLYPFIPEALYMRPESISEAEDEEDEEGGILKHGGRIYHPADERFGGYGLIRSTLAQEIGNFFVLDEKRLPVAFKWKGEAYKLNNQLAKKLCK